MLKKKATLLAFLLAATMPSHAAQQDAVDLIALRAETQGLEQHMYTVYNGLNSNDEFDVSCGERKVTGSAIPAWTCEAAFMRSAASNDVATRFDNAMSGAANTQGGYIPQSSRQIAFKHRRKAQQLNEDMMALARQHAELASAMIAFNDKRLQLEAAEK